MGNFFKPYYKGLLILLVAAILVLLYPQSDIKDMSKPSYYCLHTPSGELTYDKVKACEEWYRSKSK